MISHGSVSGKNGTAPRRVEVLTASGGINAGTVWVEIQTRSGNVEGAVRFTPDEAWALADTITKAADDAYRPDLAE